MPQDDKKYDFSDIVEEKPANNSQGGNYDFSDIVEEKKKKISDGTGSTPPASGTATGTQKHKSALEGIKGSPPDHASPDDLVRAYYKAHPAKKIAPVVDKNIHVKDITDFNQKYGTNYNTLEEFTTKLPDEETRKFFENIKPEKGVDKVAAYMDLYKKYGSPRIRQITPKESSVGRSYYDVRDNTIYLTDPNDFISELSHSKQNKEGEYGVLTKAKNFIKSPYYNQKTYDEGIKSLGIKGQYETEGTTEYNAHEKIQPIIQEESDSIENLPRKWFFGNGGNGSEGPFSLPNANLNVGDKNGNTGTVMSLPPKSEELKPVSGGQYAVDQFNKKYGTEYTIGQMTGKEKVPEPLPALEAAGKNILATSDRVLAGALKLPMNATRIIANPILSAVGVGEQERKDMLDSFEDQDAKTRTLKMIADHYDREGNKLSEEISANVNMKPKNFVEAANKYGTQVSGFLPYMMALPVAGEVGGTALMTSEQRNANEANPNMTESQKDLNAALKGMIMGVGVPFAGKIFGSNFGKLVEKVGLSEAKATVAKSTQEAITSALKPYTPLTKPLVGAATGIGIELGNHFADKLTDPNYKGEDLEQRLFDAATTFGLFQAAGVAAGGIFHGAQSKMAQAKLKKAQSEIDNLDTHLANEELSPVAKESIEEQRQKKMGEINDVIQKEEAKTDNLMPEHKAQVVRLTNEASALEADLAKLDPADPTVKILEDKINAIHKEKDAIINDNTKLKKEEADQGRESEADMGDIIGEKVEPKEKTNDSQDKTGVQGGIGKGKEPIPAESDEGAGAQETGGRGILQKQGKVTTEEEDLLAHEEHDAIESDIKEAAKKKGVDITDDELGDVASLYTSFQGSGTPMTIDEVLDLHAENKETISDIKKLHDLQEELPKAKTEAKKKEIQDHIDDMDDKIGITHAETKKIREELGIPEYEKSVRTQKEIEETADKKLKAGYDINKLIKKMDEGNLPSDVEQEIMKNYLAGLTAKIEKNPTDELIAEARRAVEMSDKIGGSEVARSLRARRGLKGKDESLMDYFMQEMDVNQDAPLTDAQKETVKKEYADITAAKEALEEKLSKLEEENNKLKAEAAIKRSKSSGSRVKKSHEEHVADRKKIAEDMKKKLADIRKAAHSTIIPYSHELVAIAPDVAKMVDSYVADGIDRLDDIIKGIHETTKEAIPDITERDVKALIAGEYNKKKLTKNEIAAKINDLKKEAKLILKLEDLKAGKEPVLEQKKIQRNQEISALSKQIKEHDLSKLSSYKKRVTTQIENLEQELKQPIIEEKEVVSPKLDKEALALKDKYIRLKQQRQMRIMKQEYANRTRYEKNRDRVLEVANVPRTLMSSMDFSAPLRQALVATTAHPILASKAFGEMFKQAVSQKRFDRWFHDVREDARYPVAEESGLYIADPHDPRLSAKEEQFMNNLAEKIPVVGKLIKGSERAYVGYLNKMRWDLFNQLVEEYQKQGKTIHNDPTLYKGAADFVNNATGRGKLGALEKAAPVLNSGIFAPRLIASRLNFLNPMYYSKLPKEVRVQALKDVSKTIALGMSVLTLAKLNGAQVEDDPRSTDFGKIKIGNTRWDIWGGYQQYIRVLTQLMTGETKSSTTGKMSTLDGSGAFGRTRGDVLEAFVRGKLSPLASVGADILAGRTVTGEEVTWRKEVENHMLPLLYNDVNEAMKEQGVKGMFTAGIPAMFGVGVSTYSPRHDKYKK